MSQVEIQKILAVDTSSLTGSVALCEGGRLVAESLLNVRATHSEKLLQQIDLLLLETGWQLSDLDLLVTVTGPGSFTGLRIGIATVKGLAQALDKPVIGVSSLQMVALNVPVNPYPVCAFIDARKKEVYSQLFAWRDGLPVALGDAQVLPPETVLKSLPPQVVLVGDGVPLYRSVIEQEHRDDLLLAPDTAHQPRATQAAWLAWQRFLLGESGNPSELLPTYIRPSDAELSKTK